jgi:hypothetical protein
VRSHVKQAFIQRPEVHDHPASDATPNNPCIYAPGRLQTFPHHRSRRGALYPCCTSTSAAVDLGSVHCVTMELTDSPKHESERGKL